MTGIERAIEAAGGEAQLAAQLGVTQQAVNKMKHKGFAPQERAFQIAELTGVAVRDLLDPMIVELWEKVSREGEQLPDPEVLK
jgi:DNA-binding transcriptional regulator YdaS (Cro superfamily)